MSKPSRSLVAVYVVAAWCLVGVFAVGIPLMHVELWLRGKLKR